MTGWTPTPQVPIAFGGQLACGWDGDIFSGDVDQPLYGSARLSMSFYLPSSQPSINIAVVSLQVGSPTAPLVVSIGGQSADIQPVQVPSSSPGWTPFVSFAGPFSPGYYTLTVTSPSSTSTSYYRAFLSFLTSWTDPNARASYSPPPGYSGNSGASVVWVQDASGNDLAVLPFGDMITPPGSMTFVADADYPVNCIAPWLSDMEYQFKPYSDSWLLQDLTAGTSLGSAPASQYYNSHGIQGVVPFQLPSAVNLLKGHTYQVSITGALAYLYGILLRGSTVDPAKAAPGGVNPYWYGELAYADFSAYRVLDYGGPHILTQGSSGGIGGQAQVGVRFVASGGTLGSVSLKMYDGNGTPGNYPAGTPMVVSVFASNDSASNVAGAQPSGPPLASTTVDSGTVPYNGFFTAPGLSFAIQAGKAYWVVWSAPSAATNAYVPQRCVSPWRNLMLVSNDGGVSWFYPGQGPSDVSWHAGLADGTWIGSPYDDRVSVPLGPSTYVAQPFMLSQAATVNAIFAYGIGGGVVKAGVYSDDGTGTGPNMSAMLGEGTFDTAFSYFYSGVVIPFGSATAALQANTKYWIVFSSSGSGSMGLASYWTRPSDPMVPAGYEALVGNGGPWAQASPKVATAIFMVGTDPGAPPPPTPVPTTLTLTAKAL